MIILICLKCNKECERTSNRQKVCIDCRDSLNKEQNKKWYKENMTPSKQYWRLHPEKLKEYNDRNEIREKKRLWARENYDPEKKKKFNKYAGTIRSKELYRLRKNGYNDSFIETRLIIFRRDKYTCQDCGCSDKRRLIPHHRDGNKKNDKLNNLITVCRECHPRRHNRFNKPY